ncbi:peptidoglycan DD-metalloendopeptidase family protein [Actinomadura sp. NPDC000600]|uniref:M23 family metallopeptidase n=1 Tax=Actinomadura sp. NPDC000600 TaxID=3154262 RepID=UPI003397BBC0
MSSHQPGGRSILPLANRITWLGGAGASAVLLILSAVVAQTVAPARSGPARASVPASGRTRPVHGSHPSEPARPAAKSTPLVRTVRAVVLRQRAPLARRDFGGHAPAAPRVLLSRSDPARGWAFGSSVLTPPEGVDAPPDASLFIARRARTGWHVAVTGSETFTAYARQAPDSVVPKAERSFLAAYGKAAASKDTGLSLPWGAGKSWTMRPTGSAELIAFTGGDGRVLAAGSGRLYRLCSREPAHGMLLLIHPNGLASTYSQMSALANVKDGAVVQRGAYLGTAGNEESCTGAHVDGAAAVVFGVLSGGRPVPLDSLRIGGWTLDVPASGPIQAERPGLRIQAGDPLLNLGVAPGASPAPSARLSPTAPAPSRSVGVLMRKAS